MAPGKKTYEVNPECLVTMTKLTERMAMVVADQKEIVADQKVISETIWGNGKTGLKEQTAQNTRDIVDITTVLKDYNETKEKETEQRIKEEKDRKKISRGWWLAIAMAIIVAVISIAQDVTTQIALAKLLSK